MKKIFIPLLSLWVVSCSTDLENVTAESFDETAEETPSTVEKTENSSDESTNTSPVFKTGVYSINEHSPSDSSVGFISATDDDNDEITYTLESDADIIINESTGEIKTGTNLKLDFETTDSYPFTVSAFDGKIIVDQSFNLAINDIDETTILSEEQKEIITYAQHLTFWKGVSNTPLSANQKWGSPMKMYLNGTISQEYKTTVESVITQYNTLFTDSSFSISLVENSEAANANLFFGTKEEVETIWPDMYEEIKDGNYDGFAMTPSENSVLVSTRIWISNPLEVLLKHELGHALGFGHSDKCEDEFSFLCSQISADNDFLPVEKDIIRFMYSSKITAGLTENEMEIILADIILNEE